MMGTTFQSATRLRAHRESGTSMIEVLVTMAILAFGVLGLAGLQLSALKYNKDASSRSTATMLAIELSDRMRANTAGVKAGNYNRDLAYAAAKAATVSAPGCGSTSDCTAANMANKDLSEWLAAIAASLPQGTGAVEPVATGATDAFARKIVIMWNEKSLQEATTWSTTDTDIDSNCKTPRVAGVRCFATTFIP